MLPLYERKLHEDLLSAERNIRDTLAKEPESSVRHQRALRQLAGVVMQTRRFEEALDIYRSTESAFVDNAGYWAEVGVCKLLLGECEAGFAAISRSMTLDPSQCKDRNHADNAFLCDVYERLQKLATNAPKAMSLDKEQLWDEYWQEISRPWKDIWGE